MTPGRVLFIALLVVFVFFLVPGHVKIGSYHILPGWAPYLPYVFG
jgi:hypothetical protein